MARIGHARVSTKDQATATQADDIGRSFIRRALAKACRTLVAHGHADRLRTEPDATAHPNSSEAVPTVRHVLCTRNTLSRRLGMDSRTVARDDLDTRPLVCHSVTASRLNSCMNCRFVGTPIKHLLAPTSLLSVSGESIEDQHEGLQSPG